ncbi:MAG: tetraacyldisaccharide 4'-kinase [Deltaproteobacteria bacterium]|nr:tetraacyldisaccharide 4'-kinase [Deltaproteobacteria bacterium]
MMLAHIPRDEKPSAIWIPLLGPASWMFGAVVALRRLAYRSRLFSSHRVSVPVISVGNLRVGGGGKTPFIRLLLKHLEDRGLRAAVVSRGYRRKRAGGVAPVIVARGEGPVVDVSTAGDEPYLIALTSRAFVAVDADRVAAAEALVGLGVDVILLDDGFQHWRIARDLDIVLLPASPMTDSAESSHVRTPADRLLPLGSLREPVRALDRADLIVVNHTPPHALPFDETLAPTSLAAPAAMAASVEGAQAMPRIDVVTAPVGFVVVGQSGVTHALSEINGRRVALFSAIARPATFEAMMTSLGATVVLHHAHADHAWPSQEALEAFLRVGRAAGATHFVTTEKDAVKFPAPGAIELSPFLWCLQIEQRVVSGMTRLVAAIDRVLGGTNTGTGTSKSTSTSTGTGTGVAR